jgi:ABC-type Co2+ transport system permease subunit
MARVLVLLVAAYVAAYVTFRLLNTEFWAADGKPYVIFPSGFTPIYYVFRPLSYLDAILTGTGAHIGPHQ